MSTAHYKGYYIRKLKEGYQVLGTVYPTLLAATNQIDAIAPNKA